jgi:hypothetical protein
MSPYHAKGLQGFAELQNDEIVHLRTRFGQGTLDQEWIQALGAEQNWIIVSGDIRITRSPIEQRAWHESQLTAFFFVAPFSNDGFWKQAAALVFWWPRIMQQSRATPTGHGFLVPKSGKAFTKLYPR